MSEKNVVISVNMFQRGVRPIGLTPFAHQQSQNWFFYPTSGMLKYSDSDVECFMEKGKLYLLPYKKLFSLTDIENVRFNHLFIAFNSTQPIYKFMQFDIEKDSFLKNYLQFLNNNYTKIQQTTNNAIEDVAVPLVSALLSHLFPGQNSSNSFAEQIRQHIDKNMPIFDFDELCTHFNYSRRYLDLKFKSVFELSIFKYAKNKQFAYIANMLVQNISLSEICDVVNYSSVYNLSRDFSRHYGMTPLEYRAFVNDKKPTKGPKRK